MIIDFQKKYGYLQVEGVSVKDGRKDRYLTRRNASLIPPQYRKSFEHSPNGFVEKYCKI